MERRNSLAIILFFMFSFMVSSIAFVSAADCFKDSIGLYNSANTAFWLRNSNSAGNVDYAFYYGQPGVGLIPIAGDWDGDGKDSVGLYNKTTGWFWLINKNEYSAVDIAFRYGNYYDGKGGINDWYPIVGDWDGNGKDEIAIYNKIKSEFWFRLDTSSVQRGYGFQFGNVYDNTGKSFDWYPIAGDWNNDGKDEIGLYSQAKSEFWLRSNVNVTGASAYGFFLGQANLGLLPIVGDWNNDGIDSIGLYNSANTAFWLKNNNSVGLMDYAFYYGQAGIGLIPIAGNFDNSCSCIPKSCSQLGKQCGSYDDGCSGIVTCGCSSGQTCNSNGQCIQDIPNLVKRNGNEFYLNGKPFYFSGANNYYLWIGNWTCPAGYQKNQGCSKEVLDDMKAMNLSVARVWGFSDGYNYWGTLQTSKGVYNEAGFLRYDRLLKEARDRDIKLIIPLVNNWNDFGGMCQYVNWCGIADADKCDPMLVSGAGAISHDKFYTDSCTRQAYKDYVNYFLNRVNTLTGVKYKDDPTIFAWELANEPRARSDPSQTSVDNWIEEMSNYIKTIDGNHMVTVGLEGFSSTSDGVDFSKNINHNNIDFAAFHLFVGDWGYSVNQGVDYIKSHVASAKAIGKPVILEEVGYGGSYNPVAFKAFYNALESSGANGDLIWMLKDINYPDWDPYGFDYPEDIELGNLIISHNKFMKSMPVNPQMFWLKRQQDLYGTGLLDSYYMNENDNAYSYDQAVAAIAFINAGEIARAKKIFDKMKSLQGSSGQWYDCYSAASGNRCAGYTFYDSGPILWMVIAINYYEAKTGDTSYSSVAAKALGWTDGLQHNNPSDERYGAVRYSDTATIISTEHNHDAYSAYYWRGNLTNNNSYVVKANLVRDYLIREMWAPSATSNSIHNVNVFWRGYNDTAWCTDTQSWGVLSLGTIGPNGENLTGSLEWLHYNPYGSTRNQKSYDAFNLNIDGFMSCTENKPYVWSEGTEGVAMAFKSINDERGNYYHNQISLVPSVGGGKVHAFNGTDTTNIVWPHNYRYEGVASTGWYYLADKNVNPFRPK